MHISVFLIWTGLLLASGGVLLLRFTAMIRDQLPNRYLNETDVGRIIRLMLRWSMLFATFGAVTISIGVIDLPTKGSVDVLLKLIIVPASLYFIGYQDFKEKKIMNSLNRPPAK